MRAPAADAQPADRGLASFIEAFRRVARLSERGAIEEHDNVISIATGMPVPAFNPTIVVRPPRDAAGAMQRVRDFYTRCGIAGEVCAWDDTADAIADAATGAGLVAGHRIPCLLLEPLVSRVAMVPDLQVRRVDDAATLLRFNDVCAEVFGLEREVIAALDEPWLLELPGSALHLGFVDGAPVATAWSYAIDGVVLLQRGHARWPPPPRDRRGDDLARAPRRPRARLRRRVLAVVGSGPTAVRTDGVRARRRHADVVVAVGPAERHPRGAEAPLHLCRRTMRA